MIDKASASLGITLLELMIVVIIVGILASLAMPMFKGATIRAKMAEFYATVSTIEKAEEIYFAEHGEYDNDLAWSDTDGGQDFRDRLGVDIPANAKFGYIISGTPPPAITVRVKGISGNLCEKWIRDGWVKKEHPWAKYLSVP